ncbi:alpha/beta fold hydrolase [Pseudomonas sp. BGI-2]|uniref:alpha/beta fold hydrolase n=1 Tax=Pseudomonas sp. BGI-2 TaxID=2528211 RepID=UPI0021156E6A|nr:alpha/beta fold hydrolase [Pseudomonas sp. BGI-2]
MTQSGESASSDQKNEKLRPQAQMMRSWVNISGIKPMIEARKPKMIKSHLSWHKIAPRLAKDFTVVCTDLRGYGDSSKPERGGDHSDYSFRAMAQD